MWPYTGVLARASDADAAIMDGSGGGGGDEAIQLEQPPLTLAPSQLQQQPLQPQSAFSSHAMHPPTSSSLMQAAPLTYSSSMNLPSLFSSGMSDESHHLAGGGGNFDLPQQQHHQQPIQQQPHTLYAHSSQMQGLAHQQAAAMQSGGMGFGQYQQATSPLLFHHQLHQQQAGHRSPYATMFCNAYTSGGSSVGGAGMDGGGSFHSPLAHSATLVDTSPYYSNGMLYSPLLTPPSSGALAAAQSPSLTSSGIGGASAFNPYRSPYPVSSQQSQHQQPPSAHAHSQQSQQSHQSGSGYMSLAELSSNVMQAMNGMSMATGGNGGQMPQFPSVGFGGGSTCSEVQLNRNSPAFFPRRGSWSSLPHMRDQQTPSPMTNGMRNGGGGYSASGSTFGSFNSGPPQNTPVLLLTLIHSQYQENEHPMSMQSQRVASMKPFQSSVEHRQRVAAEAESKSSIDTISTGAASGSQGLVGLHADEQNGWLRVPIPTLDEVHDVFVKFGRILRLICFFKDGLCKCLIEYSDAGAAAAARLEFDGKEMRSGLTGDRFGKMRVGFSQYAHITIDELQLQKGQGRDYEQESNVLADPHSQGQQTSDHLAASQATTVHEADETANPVLKIANLAPQTTCEHLRALFGLYGPIAKIKFCYYGRSAALIEFAHPAIAKRALDHLHLTPLFQRRIDVTYSRHESVSFSMQTMGMQNAPQHRDYSQDLSLGVGPGLSVSPSIQMLTQSGLDLQSPSSTLCLHDVPQAMVAADLFKMLQGSLAFPPSRFHAAAGPSTLTQTIYLLFTTLPAAVDALAQHNGQPVTVGHASSRHQPLVQYEMRITFAPPRTELTDPQHHQQQQQHQQHSCHQSPNHPQSHQQQFTNQRALSSSHLAPPLTNGFFQRRASLPPQQQQQA